MRPGILVTLAGTWLVVVGLTIPVTGAQSVRTSSSKGKSAAAPPFYPTLTVEAHHTSRDEAARQALLKAQEEVVPFLRQHGLPVDRTPPVDFIQQKMVKELQPLPSKQLTDPLEIHELGGPIRHGVAVQIQLTPEVRENVVKWQRGCRSQERMLWLGKVLGGLVIFLAAAAAYFRLDEWTKGYYSTWLTLGAAGIILASIVVLLSA